MANSTISSSISPRDEKWMRCCVHVLQNCMKSVFSQCGDDACLRKIGRDFKSVKRIAEDSELYGWNKDLIFGYKLIQDVDTRFGTLFLVTESFLKSSSKVWDIAVLKIAKSCANILRRWRQRQLMSLVLPIFLIFVWKLLFMRSKLFMKLLWNFRRVKRQPYIIFFVHCSTARRS